MQSSVMSDTECYATDKPHQLEEIRDIATCAICLELFDNARILSCSHSFCLNCLWALSEESPFGANKCPQCRALSIPPQSKLSGVNVHTFLNQLADLVREHESGGAEEMDNDDTYGDELFVGDLLPPSVSEQAPRRSKTARVAINVLKGVATIASLGIGGLYFNKQASKRRRQLEQCIAQDSTKSFTCDFCLTNQKYSESELRFKCGMCEDFNLCLGCIMNPSAHTHRPDHIFLKLKFKQRRQLPSGCLLKYKKARDMSDELDFTSNRHGRTYYHTQARLEWRDGISCAFCGETPITGIRYKCGMCKDYDLCGSCEEYSDKIHDSAHIFLVFKCHAKINIISEPLIKALLY